MMLRTFVAAGLIPVLSISIGAQESRSKSPGDARPVRTAYYVDPLILNVDELIDPPPAASSSETRAELSALHRIEETRTDAQVSRARADDAEEDIFAYRTVFGPAFTPEELPLTAALAAHVKNEQSVIGGKLKTHFDRLRPYQEDPSLHPVCRVKALHDSYPSGHALTGYLEALTLAEMIPERRNEILARADDYAHNRLVCGVHYPSDLEASRRIAYLVFGYMLATPRFQRDLAAAEVEIRSKLAAAPK